MQAYLFQHFASHGHNGFLEDCTINLADKSNVAGGGYWRLCHLIG